MTTIEIKLTELEKQIFDILIQTVLYQNKTTILRAAGGWVRDKILGLPSDDIDIALDNQSGSEFATAVNEYLQQNGLETHTVAVIHANPEQSKHLETARLRVLGLELDLVNLRTETYTANSRIPSISEEFGSPLEDALRRDFTMNSLFYNLHTQQIEDLTGCGLQDLQDGLVRTPLDPSVTFTDDPLRMLRAIRFSSRFNYRLHESIREVSIKPEIHDALRLKVSKERQLKEITGCFNGPLCRPILAITTLYELNLFHVVFSLPSIESLSNELQADTTQSIFQNLDELILNWQSLNFQCSCWINCFLQILASKSIDPFLESLLLFNYPLHTSPTYPSESLNIPTSILSSPMISNIEISSPSPISVSLNTSELFWTSCVSSLRGVAVKEKKNRSIQLSQFILRDSLKLDNDMQKIVVLTLQASQSFQELLPHLPSNLNELSSENSSSLRESLGLILRECKQYWRNGLIVATSLTLSTTTHHRNPFNQSLDFNNISVEHLEIISKYRYLGSIILLLELDEIWLSKPHYDGDALISALQMKRGPQLGQLLEKQFRWQLRYPNRTGGECLEYLREELNLLLSQQKK